MSLAPGQRLGPYEIAAALGAGGMGEVYRARDPRLNRDVAIKVLRGVSADDAERLARFRREAQTLAALLRRDSGTTPRISEPHHVSTLPPGIVALDLVPGGQRLKLAGVQKRVEILALVAERAGVGTVAIVQSSQPAAAAKP